VEPTFAVKLWVWFRAQICVSYG